MSPKQIVLFLIALVVAGFFVIRTIVKRRNALHYERLRPVIDSLTDDELVRAVSSGRYQYHADLSEYANQAVVNRGLMLVQLDSEALNAWSKDLRKYKFRLSWQLVGHLIAIIIALPLTLFISAFLLGVYERMSEMRPNEFTLIPLFAFITRLLNGLIPTYLIFRFLMMCRRARATGALRSLVERPRERPVVYLRSFAQEGMGGRIIGRTTLEEQLAFAFDQLGPFVAIGAPGEGLPRLGAARFYVTDDKWQGVVTELMSKAQLLVLRIGYTAGFWWEFQKAVSEVPPERLLLLMPRDKHVYNNFRLWANEFLPVPLPEYVEGISDKIFLGELFRSIVLTVFPSIGHMGSLKGVIYFDPDWTPHMVKVGLTLRGEIKAPGYAALVIAIQPMLNRLGTALYVPTLNIFRVVLLCVSILFMMINVLYLMVEMMT